MAKRDPDARPVQDPEAQLENALIQQFLRSKGVEASQLKNLPEAEAERLLVEASAYAAARLAEVEARAHFVHEIHGEG